MKILSRDFTTREKVLITILVAILIGLAYYWLVDTPVRSGIYDANSRKAALETELSAVTEKIEGLERMRAEMEALGPGGRAAYMASYNNAKEELAALNDILAGTEEYVISFAELTREGNLVRRAFTIQFTTNGYETAKQIIKEKRCACTLNVSRYPVSGVTMTAAVTISVNSVFRKEPFRKKR